MSQYSYIHKNSKGEKIIETFILLVVIGTVIYTLLTFHKLPDTVITHAGATGKADGFGNKSTLLILPLISIVSYIGLTILQKFPNIFNYPVKITEKNIDSLYSLGVKMVRCLKLFIALAFAVMTYIFSESSLGVKITAGTTIITILLVLMSIMLVYYIVKMSRQK